MRKKYNIPQAFLLLLLPLFLQPWAFAVEENARYKTAFSPAEITIGDRISYTVTVKHDSGDSVAFAWPDSIGLSPFVLIRQSVRQPQKNTTELSAELALFDIGEHALPPVAVTVFLSSGEGKKMPPVAPGMVTVKALTDSSITDLQPLKPLKQPYRPWTEYLYPLLGWAMVITILGFVGYFVRKRFTSLPAVDPARETLRKVRKLKKNLEKGVPPEKCYEQLSFLIREYLEKRYRIKALEKVTREIEEALASSSVQHADLLADVLYRADLVKFAESRPGKVECLESLDKTKKAIGATR